MVGVDAIPVLEEFRVQVADELKIEDSENAATHIKHNKHNSVTAAYYLLIKKAERESGGKNFLFERVTKEKRSYNSTGNLGAHSKL